MSSEKRGRQVGNCSGGNDMPGMPIGEVRGYTPSASLLSITIVVLTGSIESIAALCGMSSYFTFDDLFHLEGVLIDWEFDCPTTRLSVSMSSFSASSGIQSLPESILHCLSFQNFI